MLYVSPLKALNYDVERNLRGPLAGLAVAAQRRRPHRRHAAEGARGDAARRAPDILITTPESLFLLLTSQARELLRTVDTVILDEVHAVAGTKRGAHLALSLERLERLVGAAVPAHRPLGDAAPARGDRPLRRAAARPIELVDAGVAKQLDLEVVVPLEDMRELGVDRPLPHPAPADGRRWTSAPSALELDLAVDLSRRCSSSCASTARRSSS